MSRQLKLTTIGLRTDKELLVRAMLGMIGEKTVDRWLFSDDVDADVAICDPASQEAGHLETRMNAAISRTEIALVDSESEPKRGSKSLGYPVRAAELVDLLNAVSDSLTARELARRRQQPERNESVRLLPSDPGEHRFAFALRELLRLASKHPYRVTANGIGLSIIPATRSMLLEKPLDEKSIALLIAARSDVLMSPMSEKDLATLVSNGATPKPIDSLLWRVGLESRNDRLLPDLPQDGYFALKRWPDFGGTAPNRNHLRMASVLTLSAQNIKQLAKASNSTPEQARAFINACALMDLVEIRPEVSKMPPLARQQQPARSVPRNKLSGVFESIRFALGLGGH